MFKTIKETDLKLFSIIIVLTKKKGYKTAKILYWSTQNKIKLIINNQTEVDKRSVK